MLNSGHQPGVASQMQLFPMQDSLVNEVVLSAEAVFKVNNYSQHITRPNTLSSCIVWWQVYTSLTTFRAQMMCLRKVQM